MRAKHKAYLALLAVAVVFLVGLVSVAVVGRLTSGTSREPSAHDVLAAVKPHVFARLKAPATARFPSSPSEVNVEFLGNGVWLVRGWVDAQNAFGALLRNYWTCRIAHLGEGRWSVMSLEFDD